MSRGSPDWMGHAPRKLIHLLSESTRWNEAFYVRGRHQHCLGNWVVQIILKNHVALQPGTQVNELIHQGSLRLGRDFEFVFHGLDLFR